MRTPTIAQLRVEIAAQALQGLLANPSFSGTSHAIVAAEAWSAAAALIGTMPKEVQEALAQERHIEDRREREALAIARGHL